MRILITGSRDWWDRDLLEDVLAGFIDRDITLVSGACPTGADRMGEEYATSRGWMVERHPANWLRYGHAAGFIRNQQMVDGGADVCLAFIRNDSKGATMTAGIAEEAGIPVRRFLDQDVTVP